MASRMFLRCFTRVKPTFLLQNRFFTYNFTRHKTRFIYPGVVGLGVAGLAIKGSKDEEKSREKYAAPNQKSNEETIPSLPGQWRADLPTYSSDEVARHDSKDVGIWVTYCDGVYDITNFVSQHPGGDLLLVAAGKSIDSYWKVYMVHNSKDTFDLLESMRIGNCDQKAENEEENTEIDEQWINEPHHRHPALFCNQDRPFNAEPPVAILAGQFHTPNDLFYVRNHLPVPPKVDISNYKLVVTKEGSNDQSLQLTFEDLKKFPQVTISATLQCAGNRRADMSAVKPVRGLPWKGGAIGTASWTGVRLYDVLNYFGVSENDFKEIKHVQFEGFDQDAMGSCYSTSIPIETAMNPAKDVLLVFKMNGEDLPIDHGYPVRVLVPGTIGARSVKWLSRIILSSEESHSIWQRRDYKLFPSNIDISNVDFASSQAIQELPVQSAICSPMPGSVVSAHEGTITVRGYAWSGGGRGISRVDVSIDGGKEWFSADLQPEPSQKYNKAWAWTLWKVIIPLPSSNPKELNICCKAMDSSCNAQPESVASIWNFRGLVNNSWNYVTVKLQT